MHVYTSRYNKWVVLIFDFITRWYYVKDNYRLMVLSEVIGTKPSFNSTRLKRGNFTILYSHMILNKGIFIVSNYFFWNLKKISMYKYNGGFPFSCLSLKEIFLAVFTLFPLICLGYNTVPHVPTVSKFGFCWFVRNIIEEYLNSDNNKFGLFVPIY